MALCKPIFPHYVNRTHVRKASAIDYEQMFGYIPVRHWPLYLMQYSLVEYMPWLIVCKVNVKFITGLHKKIEKLLTVI